MLGTSVAELDFMLQDAGVPASFGATSTFGILHTESVPTMTESGFGLNVYRTVLRIRPGTLGAIKTGSAITVNGVAYKVRNIGELEDDGLLPVTIGRA